MDLPALLSDTYALGAIIAGIALLNLAHRLWLLPREPMTFDSWGHLYFTFAVGRGGRGPFRPIVPRVVGAEDFHYPLLPHWSYSFLPERFLLRHNRLINPLVETVFLVLATALALAAGMPREWVLIGALGYVFTPLWFSKVAIGPRVLNFTTRLFSEVLFPLALAIVLFPLPIPDWVAVLAGGALLCAVLLGSKFGVQTVVLVTPVVALVAMSAKLAIAGVLAAVLAQAISRGGFAAQLGQQAAHLRWYLAELREGRMPIDARNSYARLREWSDAKTKGENLRRLVFNWCATNSVTGVILRAPHLPATAVLGAAALLAPDFPASPALAPLAQIVAGASVIYALTSLRAFLFLGEAERYLSHASIWSNMLFVALCAASGAMVLVWLAIAYGAAFTIAERFLLRGGVNPAAQESEAAVMQYLKAIRESRTVIVYPHQAVPPYRIMIETPHVCVLPWLAGSAHKAAMKGVENYPRVDLAQLERCEELRDVDTLVVDRRERAQWLPGWHPPEGWHAVDGAFGQYDVYERAA